MMATLAMAACLLGGQEADADAAAREALAAECGLDFAGQSVAEMLSQLSETRRLGFVADLKSAPKVREQKIKATPEGTIGEVLAAVLKPHGLAHAVWEGVVLVATPAALKEFAAGKVPVVSAKTRASAGDTDPLKKLYDLLSQPVTFDLAAGFRTGDPGEKSIATGFGWLGDMTGATFTVDGSAAKACARISTMRATNAPAAVALALLAREAGVTFTLERPTTVRVRR